MDSAALIDELNRTVAAGSFERRIEIVHRVTDLFLLRSASYSDEQIGLFDDVLVRVAADIELSARAALAKKLASEPRAPARISRALASDEAIDVAGPILEHSQQLDDETLLNAARSQSQQHLLAISRRELLGEALTDILVERGDKSVVLSAVRNPGARFSDQGYATLAKRSDGDDELTISVGSRPDIPRHLLIRLVAKASHAVQQKLESANPSLAAEIREAVSDAEKTVLKEATAGARDYTEARKLIEQLRDAGKLDENAVAEFARKNQFEETTAALAVLCELPIEVVYRAMDQYQPDAALIIVRALGMSRDTARAILRLRAGSRGSSPGEVDRCLESFARLSPVTAKQLIKFRKNPVLAVGSRFTRAPA